MDTRGTNAQAAPVQVNPHIRALVSPPTAELGLKRLDDVLAAASAITSHLQRGTLADGLIFDAVRVRLIEIGEAVKDIDAELLANEPDIPWKDVARMRDHLTHRYFDTDHAIVGATVEHDLPPLVEAAQRLQQIAESQE